MARRRWRVRCRAHRTNGQPCRNWAITGGRVCRVHGGATRQARLKAGYRLVVDSLNRQYDAETEALLRRLARWYEARIEFIVDVLDVDPAEVSVVDVERWWREHPPGKGWPADLADSARPQRRRDHRFGRRPRPRTTR